MCQAINKKTEDEDKPTGLVEVIANEAQVEVKAVECHVILRPMKNDIRKGGYMTRANLKTAEFERKANLEFESHRSRGKIRRGARKRTEQ